MKTFAPLAMLFGLFIVGCTGARTGSTSEPPRPALNVVMFSGSSEYKSNDSLEAFKKVLEEKHHCKCTLNVVPEKGDKLPGIEGLETADVAIFFTRRVSLSEDQLAKVKKYIASGRGVVGVRTASHGFQTWLEFDPQILGGSYGNHYSKDETADVTPQEKAKEHPILKGVTAFTTDGKLYKNPKLADDATLLLSAKTPTTGEPVAWCRDAKAGERGRVFYTSLGVPKDFENPNFQQLLVNAVLWAAKKD
jgi:type 1 glutamine amidotransferase